MFISASAASSCVASEGSSHFSPLSSDASSVSYLYGCLTSIFCCAMLIPLSVKLLLICFAYLCAYCVVLDAVDLIPYACRRSF